MPMLNAGNAHGLPRERRGMQRRRKKWSRDYQLFGHITASFRFAPRSMHRRNFTVGSVKGTQGEGESGI